MGELRCQGWSPPQHPRECRVWSPHTARSRASGGFWGAGQGSGCWKGPGQAPASTELHLGVTLDPNMAGGERQQQCWEEGGSGRGTGYSHWPQDQPCPEQLCPSHPCPKPQGCLPTCGLGSEWPREPKKSKRQQLPNHRSPFIAQLSRAETQKPALRPSLTQPAVGTGPWEQEGAPPCLFPSSHRLCSRGWSRAGSQTCQVGWRS